MSKNTITIESILDALEPLGIIRDFSCPRSLYQHEFTHLSYNSSDIEENTFFICKGINFKTEYLLEAIVCGAGGYISETKFEISNKIPFIQVSDIRKAMSIISKIFYNEAYKDFALIGITGTKGKTTTSYFMKNILDTATENPTAILSTIEVYTGISAHEAHLTTPESPDLHKYFQQTKESSIPYLTMEVSSQAYKMDRVYGIDFDIAIFLNIGEDHIGSLEHDDFEDYFSCKLELIKHSKKAVINRDMENYERVLDTAKKYCKEIYTFGTGSSWDASDAKCFKFEDIEKIGEGFVFNLRNLDNNHQYKINMAGRFNIENAVAAIICAKSLGIDEESISLGLLKNQVEGRMNLFEKEGVTILVDYAHNYLSFSKLYQSLKMDYPGKRIVVLFGCPGGHAYLRRKDIGSLSGEYADYIYLTAEDPQFEDVQEICEEIATYIKPYNTPYEIITDRTAAVEKAIKNALPGDLIVLAAKGEEVYQKVRGEYISYESDLAIVKRFLSK